MAKKILLGLVAVLVVAGGVAAMSAFEAHIINVTATIENALKVSRDEITFGTVFPQEYLEEDFKIYLSDSFVTEDRVDGVRYEIHQKPKPRPGGGYYPDLCPFLSKLSDGSPANDTDAPSYYVPGVPGPEPVPAHCITPGEASGYLAKSAQDTFDTWTVDLKVPPIDGSVGQDWPEDCPTIDVDGADWGCDLWVEVTGIDRD
jgi:hypothetical protein